MSQRKCRMGCVGSTAEYLLTSKDKQETGVHHLKCHVGYVGVMQDRSRVHARQVGGRYDHGDYVGVLKII